MLRIVSLTIVFSLAVGLSGCKKSEESAVPPEDTVATKVQTVAAQTVMAGCGGCIFKMDGVEGCKLAVRLGNKAYLVEGADVDAHQSGLCSAAKPAEVAGKLENGKFVASQFTLKP